MNNALHICMILKRCRYLDLLQHHNCFQVIQNTDMNQSVYIYRCEGSTVKVEGKVNNIILDGCKKTAVVFQDVVSACEFINCQSVQMQVNTAEQQFLILV